MRIILAFAFLLSFSANAEHSLKGVWEGFNFDFKEYHSHILKIDQNGHGFYALSISGGLNEQNVYPINLGDLTYEEGYYKFIAPKQDDKKVTVLFASDMLNTLKVITIIRGPDNQPFWSIAWELVLTGEELQNKRLYDFSNELYNKRIK